jgi:hypothetical protein
MIQPEFKPLIEILNGKLFDIPEYQRHYSWERKQRQDLFKDIEKLIETNDVNKSHFMATIVCLKTPAKKTYQGDSFTIYEVVDGQQRLTTLIVLLKAISLKLCSENELKPIAEKVDALLVKDNQQLVILQSNHDNKFILREYLNAKKGDSLSSIRKKAKTAADKNLCDAIDDCKDFVGKIKDSMRLLDLVKTQLHFVLLTLEDKRTVYTIFEVLNSRGLAVDWLDKCKSVLMGLLYECTINDESTFKNLLKELQDNWSLIYKEIGIDGNISGDEIIRFTATLMNTDGSAKKIMSAEKALDFIRTSTKDSIKKILVTTEMMRKVTICLSELQQHNEHHVVSDILQARFLAVAIMLRDDLDTKLTKQLLSQWECTSFKIYGLFRKDSRSKIAEYVSAAKKVQEYQVKTDIKDLLKSIAEIGKDFDINHIDAELKGDCYNGWERKVRYFFSKYEEYVSAELHSSPNSAVWKEIWSSPIHNTIEHIMPQNENATGWAHITQSQHEEFLHSIGNLCLLSPSLNSQANDNSFSSKKLVYDRANINALKSIATHRKWGENEIKERTATLIEFAKEQWKDIV